VARRLLMRRGMKKILLAALLLAACSKSDHQWPSIDASHYPESESGLQLLVIDMVNAAKSHDTGEVKQIADSMKLDDPKAFYAATFGDDAAPRLAAEYDEMQLATFAADADQLLQMQLAKGRDVIAVEKHTSPDDDSATGYQSTALKAMKQPVALYTVRLREPGHDSGFTLWSFVWVDGRFRLAGKMKKVDTREIDPALAEDLDMLSELPIADAREILKQ
jgi:hypothetical protein